MMDNLEKLKTFVSNEKSDWIKRATWRAKNEWWLKYWFSFRLYLLVVKRKIESLKNKQ